MYSERREQAIRLMLRAHEGQIRKAEPEIPYVAHLIHVGLMVLEAGGDEDTVIAALLHDVLEDTDVKPEDLDNAFGPRVTALVREVTEDKTLGWADRKTRMIEQLRRRLPRGMSDLRGRQDLEPRDAGPRPSETGTVGLGQLQGSAPADGRVLRGNTDRAPAKDPRGAREELRGRAGCGAPPLRIRLEPLPDAGVTQRAPPLLGRRGSSSRNP